MIEKKCGDGKLIIQRLVDGLWFMRYDFMWVNSNWNSSGKEEPEWILVFLDESNHSFDIDREYQQKRMSYKKRILADSLHNLNLDHRLVSAESYLRWIDLLKIAEKFFKTRNTLNWKIFDAIVVNHVWQISVIQRLLKNWFSFLDSDQENLFNTIRHNPEQRIESDYTSPYGDFIKNMLTTLKRTSEKVKMLEDDLIVFQMKKEL